MKIKGVFLAAILTAVLSISGNLFAYSGGDGNSVNPYQIANVADFQQLTIDDPNWNKSFILTADVNLAGVTLTPVGNSSTKFTGVFDGNDNIISNAVINQPSSDYIGLFGYVSGGQILNLGVEHVNITGDDDIGGLVGYNYGSGSSISNCYSMGTVSGGPGSRYVGGLVGVNYGSISNCCSTSTVSSSSSSSYVGGLVGYNSSSSGSINNCYSTGMVSGYSEVGGLVGKNASSGSIINCYSTGKVSGYSSGWSVGGLVGDNSSSSVINCYSGSDVNGSSSASVGGLVGSNSSSGSISDCYSTGTVSSSSSSVGGLVGWSGSSSIINCYSRDTVSGSSNVGGLVGYDNYCSISNCYSTGAVSGSSNVGGLVGDRLGGSVSSSFWDKETSGRTTSDGGTGKTTAQMKTLSTFTGAGWDFTNETANGTNNIWRMCVNGVNYPHLNWESIDGDFACPDGVNFVDFAYFAERWPTTGCNSSNNYCGGADMDTSGTVDILDFAMFAENWLAGI